MVLKRPAAAFAAKGRATKVSRAGIDEEETERSMWSVFAWQAPWALELGSQSIRPTGAEKYAVVLHGLLLVHAFNNLERVGTIES